MEDGRKDGRGDPSFGRQSLVIAPVPISDARAQNSLPAAPVHATAHGVPQLAAEHGYEESKEVRVQHVLAYPLALRIIAARFVSLA